MRQTILLALVSVAGFSCGGDSPVVQCSSGADCNIGSDGQCIPYGPTGHTWCSYADEACPGGRRWSDFGTGDGVSGECVSEPDAGLVDAAADATVDADPATPDAAPLPCSLLVTFVDGALDKREVYVSKVDGTDLINISKSPDADDTDPRWSPFRDRIVFASNRRGNWDVILAAANGEWQRNLTEDSAATDRGAAWSPDGNRLAFERNSQLWIMNSDGASPQPLVTSARVTGTGRTIEWSPDGTKIIFSAMTPNSPDIFVVDVSGATPPINLTNTRDFAETSASWSPDGRAILYSNYLDSFVINPDGTGGRPVTAEGMSDSSPVWMPDGLSFLFSGRGTTAAKIYRQSLAGGTPAELTTGEGAGDASPDVAPDASMIAFVRESSDHKVREIGVANADGTNPVFFSGGERKVVRPFFTPRCR